MSTKQDKSSANTDAGGLSQEAPEQEQEQEQEQEAMPPGVVALSATGSGTIKVNG